MAYSPKGATRPKPAIRLDAVYSLNRRGMNESLKQLCNRLAWVAGGLVLCSAALALNEAEHQQGLLLLGRGEYQAAEALYRAATERDDTDTVARSHLAISLLHQEKYDEAESHLSIVFGQDPVYFSDRIAIEYAFISPLRAATWSLELGDVPDRPPVVSTMVIGWAKQDVEAARDWVYALPKGEMQDAGLGGLVRTISDSSVPDADLLSAFSSDLNRQRWIRYSVVPLTRRYPGIARDLIERYITDATLRQEAERFYEIGLRIRERE